MQQRAVRMAECMPIDSLQTGSPARGSECLFSEHDSLPGDVPVDSLRETGTKGQLCRF